MLPRTWDVDIGIGTRWKIGHAGLDCIFGTRSQNCGKTTNSFVISVRLSVCPYTRMGQPGTQWKDFHEI
jgi:hypothetical protein